ncbi:MAG: ATP-binding protein, partial [Actinomycetota bacterium]|nr:ATP-binding protein [Actinomycetota bacterium]
EITGWTEDELVGRILWERFSPTPRLAVSQERFVQLRNRTLGIGDGGDGGEAGFLAGGDGMDGGGGVLLEVPTADGGQRHVIMRSGAVLDDDGEPSHLVLIGVDITAERDAAGLMVHLLDAAATTAIVGTDLQGCVTIFNRGAEMILGYDTDSARQMCFEKFLVDDEMAAYAESTGYEPGFESLVARIGRDGVPETRDWTWVGRSGQTAIVSMTSQPVTNSFGKPIGYLFVGQDVTGERLSQDILVRALDREREASDRLRGLDHAKNSFISTVSHELRTPMSSIVGYAEMLQDGMVGRLAPDQLRVIDAIVRNGQRLGTLADDLLVLSGFDAGITALHSDPLDLCAIVRRSDKAIASILRRRRLDLHLELPESPVLVEGDAAYLERVLVNLLSNAVKFTPDGGSVTVQVQCDNEQALLLVTDTGIGIPEAEIKSVFQRFFRSTNAQNEAIQGTGLGLSIAETIVTAHEGTIDVTSVEGSGTTFTMRLPTRCGAA